MSTLEPGSIPVPNSAPARMPNAPKGYACCRTSSGATHTSEQTSHLVIWDSAGYHGPTLCGLTRFDHRDPETHEVTRPADLRGWSMDGGVYGPNVEQVKCPTCWERAS